MALSVNDIMLDSENDLDFLTGDFRVLPSDSQHVDLILRSYIGHFKEYPTLGVGIDLYRAGVNNNKLKTEINSNVISDGYRLNDVVVKQDNDNIKFYLDIERVFNGKL